MWYVLKFVLLVIHVINFQKLNLRSIAGFCVVNWVSCYAEYIWVVLLVLEFLNLPTSSLLRVGVLGCVCVCVCVCERERVRDYIFWCESKLSYGSLLMALELEIFVTYIENATKIWLKCYYVEAVVLHYSVRRN